MSRIGNRTIKIPTGVSVTIEPHQVHVKGPHGALVVDYNKKLIKVEQEADTIHVHRLDELQTTRMLHGTINAHISNAVHGVTQQFKKELVLKGVGYRAKVDHKKLALSLGFSHPVNIDIPEGVKIEMPSATEISIIGPDKQVVGELCAKIRSYRMPEPYKGKGVLFKNEQIIRKTGKKAEK